MDVYIMVMRDTFFFLVGPFASQEAAGAWGGDPANNPDDDPRWQTLRLPHITRPLEARTYLPGTGTLSLLMRGDPSRGRPVNYPPPPDAAAIEAIRAERANQDAQWGGPSHDDMHFPAEWLETAFYQVDRAYEEINGADADPARTGADIAALVRARLVKLAAVALAGIQSIDRRAAPASDTPA